MCGEKPCGPCAEKAKKGCGKKSTKPSDHLLPKFLKGR